jgi:hypothetical protein
MNAITYSQTEDTLTITVRGPAVAAFWRIESARALDAYAEDVADVIHHARGACGATDPMVAETPVKAARKARKTVEAQSIITNPKAFSDLAKLAKKEGVLFVRETEAIVTGDGWNVRAVVGAGLPTGKIHRDDVAHIAAMKTIAAFFVSNADKDVGTITLTGDASRLIRFYPGTVPINAIDVTGAVEADGFRRVIDRGMPFASKDSTRQHLMGVRIESAREDGARVVSTDGHRLHTEANPWPVQSDFTVYGPAWNAAKRIAGKDAKFAIVGTCIVSGPVVYEFTYGAFPDWRMVVPSTRPPHSLSFSPEARDIFRGILESAKAFAKVRRGTIHPMKLRLEGADIIASMAPIDGATWAERRVPVSDATLPEAGLILGFSASYMLDAFDADVPGVILIAFDARPESIGNGQTAVQTPMLVGKGSVVMPARV